MAPSRALPKGTGEKASKNGSAMAQGVISSAVSRRFFFQQVICRCALVVYAFSSCAVHVTFLIHALRPRWMRFGSLERQLAPVLHDTRLLAGTGVHAHRPARRRATMPVPRKHAAHHASASSPRIVEHAGPQTHRTPQADAARIDLQRQATPSVNESKRPRAGASCCAAPCALRTKECGRASASFRVVNGRSSAPYCQAWRASARQRLRRSRLPQRLTTVWVTSPE
jgi:hypothetical protein